MVPSWPAGPAHPSAFHVNRKSSSTITGHLERVPDFLHAIFQGAVRHFLSWWLLRAHRSLWDLEPWASIYSEPFYMTTPFLSSAGWKRIRNNHMLFGLANTYILSPPYTQHRVAFRKRLSCLSTKIEEAAAHISQLHHHTWKKSLFSLEFNFWQLDNVGLSDKINSSFRSKYIQLSSRLVNLKVKRMKTNETNFQLQNLSAVFASGHPVWCPSMSSSYIQILYPSSEQLSHFLPRRRILNIRMQTFVLY